MGDDWGHGNDYLAIDQNCNNFQLSSSVFQELANSLQLKDVLWLIAFVSQIVTKFLDS